MAPANEALAIARGQADPATYRVHAPAEVDVRKVREGLKLRQAEFAARFGKIDATPRAPPTDCSKSLSKNRKRSRGHSLTRSDAALLEAVQQPPRTLLKGRDGEAGAW